MLQASELGRGERHNIYFYFLKYWLVNIVKFLS